MVTFFSNQHSLYMKTLFLLLLLSVSVIAKAQSPYTAYGKLDTLKYYNVDLSYTNFNGKEVYTVNGKETDAATYEQYKAVWDNVEKCTPCYAKTYDINEQLIEEGHRYTDCQVGKWIEYYPSGAVKLTGEFKINTTSKWKNAWKRGYCSNEDGTWNYYNEAGNLTKMEIWENGELIEK